MSGTTLKWTSYSTSNVVIGSAAFGTLGAGAWVNGSATAFDNPGTTLYGVLELVLPSAVTAATGSPVFEIHRLIAPDGTNTSLPTPPGTAAGAPPTGYFLANIFANPGASFTRGNSAGVVILPGRNVFVARNNLISTGTLPSGTVLNLYTYTETT